MAVFGKCMTLKYVMKVEEKLSLLYIGLFDVHLKFDRCFSCFQCYMYEDDDLMLNDDDNNNGGHDGDDDC